MVPPLYSGGIGLIFSLNEIEAKGKRAARGAGLSWGLAEEAGKAARWLEHYGMPGTKMLLDHLDRIDGICYDDLVPVSTDGVWYSRSDRLCPLICGAALCDRAGEIATGRTFSLGPTSFPSLLVPYLADASKLARTPIGLSWLTVDITLEAGRVHIAGKAADFLVAYADSIHCRPARSTTNFLEPRPRGRQVDTQTCSRLAAFENRTYAPATEYSRLVGAGSEMVSQDSESQS